MAYAASVDISLTQWLGWNCTLRSTLALVYQYILLSGYNSIIGYSVLSVIKVRLLLDKDYSSYYFSIVFTNCKPVFTDTQRKMSHDISHLWFVKLCLYWLFYLTSMGMNGPYHHFECSSAPARN